MEQKKQYESIRDLNFTQTDAHANVYFVAEVAEATVTITVSKDTARVSIHISPKSGYKIVHPMRKALYPNDSLSLGMRLADVINGLNNLKPKGPTYKDTVRDLKHRINVR